MLKSGAYLIVNNTHAPKITNDGSMANVEADQPTKLSSIQGENTAMLRVSNLNEDMSDKKKT